MIRLDAGDWPSFRSGGPFDSDGGPSLVTGEPAPLPLGNFVVHADPFAAPPDDDPVTRGETARRSAQRALDLMQTSTAANRALDSLMTSVIEAPNWRDGAAKFDKGLAELKQKHLPRFKDAEDGASFVRDLDEVATMRRIDLKRALTEKQQAEALTGLDDTLAYYVQQAATARHDTFRDIAVERGLAAIDRMAAAGYLFPEAAKKLEAAFHARVDAADFEAILAVDPAEALKALDAGLFPQLDEQTRAKLRAQAIAQIARTDTGPVPGVEVEYRDGGPAIQTNSVGSPTVASLAANADPLQPTPRKVDNLDGVGVGDHEIPPVGGKSSATGADAAGANAKAQTDSDKGTSAAETQAPDTWRSSLGQMLNMDLGRQQGLTPHDLVNAKPLPDDLAKYNLKPGDATEANINELLPLLRADAKKLGLDVIVRWDPATGAPGFALRPEGSSAHIVQGDGALATGLNRAAEVAYALGSMLGLNFGGPAPGAVATGARAAGALKTGRAADKTIVSAGGAGGPPKSPSAPAVTEPATAAAPKASTGEKPSITLTGKELGDFGTDLKAWIKAGSEAYKKIRDQGPANHSALGEVKFTGIGLKEMRYTGADPDKWKLVPALRDIIESSTLIRTAPASPPRSDGIVKFHWVETSVSLDGKNLRVGANIAEDAQGNKFYNLNQNLDEWGKKYLPPGTISSTASGGDINLFVLGTSRTEERPESPSKKS